MVTISEPRAALFRQHRQMVFRIALKFSEKWGVSLDDLLYEGTWALEHEVCERWGRFDPSKASATTWCYHAIYWHLMRHCTSHIKQKARETPLSAFDADNDEPRGGCHAHEGNTWEPVSRVGFVERLLREVGEEGRALVRVILEAPGELADAFSPRIVSESHKRRVWVTNIRRSRKVLRSHLRGMGWSGDEIRRAWNQVESVM